MTIYFVRVTCSRHENQGPRYGFFLCRAPAFLTEPSQSHSLHATASSVATNLCSSRTKAHARASSFAMQLLSASRARCRLRLAMCCCTRRLRSSVSRIHCRRSASSCRRRSSSSLWQRKGARKRVKGVSQRVVQPAQYFMEGRAHRTQSPNPPLPLVATATPVRCYDCATELSGHALLSIYRVPGQLGMWKEVWCSATVLGT